MKVGVKKLELKELFVDAKVQRGIAKTSLNKKIKEFDINAVGVLIVSQRKDGNYYILDGQHRWFAAKENNIEKLDCEVHINLTEKEEAELFLKYNQDRVSTKSIDHFNIEVKAGVEISVDIYNILNEIGLNVSRRGIQSPKALKQVYKCYGEEILRKTLIFINEVWGIEGMKAPCIIGAANFIKLGGPFIEIEKFIKTLKKGKTKVFETIKLTADKFKVAQHYSSAEAYCQTLIGLYNKMVKDRTKWIYRDPLEDKLIR